MRSRPDLAAIHQLNAIQLACLCGRDAAALEALADRHQAALPHRHLIIDDASEAEPVAGELAARGWESSRTLFMGRPPVPLPSYDTRASEITEAGFTRLERTLLAEDTAGLPAATELAELLARAGEAIRAATETHRFAAGAVPGEPAAMASLLCDPDAGGRRVALVEQVATLRAHRDQGLARATVSAALHAAEAWGAQLVALATDAEDWPQLMYAALGFRPLGVQWAFGRRGSGGARR